MKYEENRLSVMLPVRLNPAIYKLVMAESWKDHKFYAAWVRGAIEEALKNRGITIPEPMTEQKKWEQRQQQQQQRAAVGA